MKNIFAVILLFVVAGSVAFWIVFIKSRVVTDGNMLAISASENYLKVETAESAKYISEVEYDVKKDTIKLVVKTTTLFNPFAEKAVSKVIRLNPEIKYVKVGNMTKPIGLLSHI